MEFMHRYKLPGSGIPERQAKQEGGPSQRDRIEVLGDQGIATPRVPRAKQARMAITHGTPAREARAQLYTSPEHHRQGENAVPWDLAKVGMPLKRILTQFLTSCHAINFVSSAP